MLVESVFFSVGVDVVCTPWIGGDLEGGLRRVLGFLVHGSVARDRLWSWDSVRGAFLRHSLCTAVHFMLHASALRQVYWRWLIKYIVRISLFDRYTLSTIGDRSSDMRSCNAVVYYRLDPLALIGNEIATGVR